MADLNERLKPYSNDSEQTLITSKQTTACKNRLIHTQHHL